MSKNDTQRKVLEKVGEYLDAGVCLIWIVRPKDETVTIYRSNGQIEQLQVDDTLDGEDVLPGFSCSVADIFA